MITECVAHEESIPTGCRVRKSLTHQTTPLTYAMAPIYLAQPVKSSYAGPSIFRERGISGFVPGKISELSVIGIPDRREFAYDGYYRNVDAFLFATTQKDKVWCHLPGFTSGFHISPTIPFNLPPIAFVPNFPVSSDGEDKMVAKLGEGTLKNRIGKTMVYTITRSVPNSELAKLISNASDAFGSGPDALTPIGLRAARFCRDVIAAFLATHSYAAFPKEVKGPDGVGEIRAIRCIDSKRCEGPSKVLLLDNKRARLDYIQEWKALPVDEPEPDMETPEGRESMEKPEKDYHGIKITNPGEAIYRAKPSPEEYTRNYGPSSAIPNSPGLVFPYFEGANPPDAQFLKSIVSEHFIRLLGSSPAEVKANFVSIRRGLNSLSTTTIGLEMAHMFAGIKLALTSQCRVYMVVDTEYRGFVLLGSGFSVFDGTSVYTPVPYERLVKDLAYLDPHSAGLAKVEEMLSKLAEAGILDGMIEEAINIQEYKSINKLIGLLSKIKIPEGVKDHEDTLKELNRGLRMLNFNEEPYWEINPQTVVKFLGLLDGSSKSKASITALPMAFTEWDVDYRNELYRALSAFGSEAPSVWNSTGSEVAAVESITEEQSGESRKRSKKVEEYGNMPKEILVSRKPVLLALKDWNKVFEKSAVKMNFKERAKEYRTMVVKNESDRKLLWRCLMTAVKVHKNLEGVDEPVEKKQKVKSGAAVNMDEFLEGF